MATHVIAAGDTLFSLARRYGTTVATLQQLNNIADPSLIFVGQVLVVPDAATPAPTPPVPVPPDPPAPPPPPPPTQAPTYVVASGDTLFGIAQRFGTTVADLAARNGLADPNLLQVGQVLVLGDAVPVPAPAPVADPAPVGPPPVPATLPVALFGARAADPNLLALVPLFDRWADAYQLPRDLLKALAFVESSWRVDARSPSGAIGLCQLLAATAQWVADTMLGGAALDPARAEDNVQLGARYLRYLFDLLVDPTASVAAYYQGPGSVLRTGVTAAGAAYAARITVTRPQFT